jgi:predicted GH43/DUF377 family glycosyl hydrolase
MFLLGAMTLLLVACSDTPNVAQSPTTTVVPATAATHEPQLPPTATAILASSPENESTPTQVAQTEAQVEAWREDLDYFRQRLEQIHPDPFYRVAEGEYDKALDQLGADLPTLTDERIIVALAQIVAFIDGHSAIRVFEDPANFHLYPLHLYLFSDGLFVIDAQEPYEEAVGGKVVQIGNMPVDEALAAVSPYIPHDNLMTIQLNQPNWLVRPEALMALGVIDSVENPSFIIEMADGRQQTLNPPAITLEAYRTWNDGPLAGLPQRPATLYLSRTNEPYWFTYLEESGTLYIQYSQVRTGVQSLASDIREFLEQQEVERVVLDVRLNFGGNNTTYAPLLDLFSTHPQINRPGHFFTIIGRQTFSAAANFTTELENRTHTIFVGEPMGGSPNLYGDVVSASLPNSGLQINISARYWEKSTPEDRRVWIEPDLSAPLSSKEFFGDRDPALEAILKFDATTGYHPATNPILEPLTTNGWESADIRDPYVIQVDDAYYMFYAGQDAEGIPSIGYATSENGRKWFRARTNPILTASGEGFDSHGVAAPVVVVEDGVWTLYYGAVSEPGGRTTAIGKATATAPNEIWTRNNTPVLMTGEASAWDSLSITPGSVVTVDGGYRLYYSGFSDNGQVGIGIASSVDGVEWTKLDNPETSSASFSLSDPVMKGAGRNAWDEVVWAPFVEQRDGQWEMFYHGDPISNRGTREIGLGLATSADGLQWTRPDEPFLISTTENRFPHTPNVLAIGDFLYIYFASVETGGTSGQIELEILPR